MLANCNIRMNVVQNNIMYATIISSSYIAGHQTNVITMSTTK